MAPELDQVLGPVRCHEQGSAAKTRVAPQSGNQVEDSKVDHEAEPGKQQDHRENPGSGEDPGEMRR